MKKYLLSVALLVVACISAKAQFNVGIKGGVNFSEINADNVSKSTQTGYQAGVFARIGTGFYLQPEVYVSSTGGKFTYQTSGNTVTTSSDVKFTNLSVPLLLGHSFGSKDLNFRLMVGPVYTYTFNANQTNSFTNDFNNAYNDFGQYKSSTIGFQAGGGVDIGIFTADLRYEGGLTKINPNYGQRQSLWALSVGIKFL